MSTSLPDALADLPLRCPRHRGIADAPPCPACAELREAREAEQERYRVQALTRERNERERRAEDRRSAVAACPLCDSHGYLGTVVCDHVDRTVTASRGMDSIRDTMGWSKNP